jgi:hypothetical protein
VTKSKQLHRVEELAKEIINDGNALLDSLLRIGNIDDFSIDIVDNIIIAAHHIKEQATRNAQADSDRTEIEEQEPYCGPHIF